MENNYRKQQFKNQPATSSLLEVIERNAGELALSTAAVYAGFPLYREEEEVVSADVLVISREHGVVVLSAIEHGSLTNSDLLNQEFEKAERTFTLVFSRLIKSKILQESRKNLRFPVKLALYTPENFPADFQPDDVELLEGESAVIEFFERTIAPLDDEIVSEIASVVEGAKGLLRPKDRNLKDKPATSKVALVAALEAEIRRFDKDQKHGYLVPLDGPQRIRGLAGSGKTVVLAMKAALTHLRYPSARIAYTFYTKSLYQHVKRLITRFYRQFDDQDPDWEKLQILHAWGGQTNPGLYYNACRALSVQPLTYGDASRKTKEAFDFACSDLLNSGQVRPLWNYIFVD